MHLSVTNDGVSGEREISDFRIIETMNLADKNGVQTLIREQEK